MDRSRFSATPLGLSRARSAGGACRIRREPSSSHRGSMDTTYRRTFSTRVRRTSSPAVPRARLRCSLGSDCSLTRSDLDGRTSRSPAAEHLDVELADGVSAGFEIRRRALPCDATIQNAGPRFPGTASPRRNRARIDPTTSSRSCPSATREHSESARRPPPGLRAEWRAPGARSASDQSARRPGFSSSFFR